MAEVRDIGGLLTDPKCRGTQGSEAFQSEKGRLLNAFDEAEKKARTDKVRVHAGKVAEGVFRDWLAGFLPKRFGVTAGQLVSQGLPDYEPAPEYDVVIYDQLDSPVLYAKRNPDMSQLGTPRAIPVEYVRAVIEVKSRFDPTSTAAALVTMKEDGGTVIWSSCPTLP